MTAELVQAKLQKRPFEPFDIHTSDGKSVSVKAADFAWIHPHGLTMYVCPDPNTESHEIIDLRHITKLTQGETSARG